MSALVFHTGVAALYLFALWYDHVYVEVPFPLQELADMPMKGRSIFLTVWSLILQTVYFLITLLNDVVGTDEHSPKHRPFIRKLRDLLFSVAFPIAIFVSMVFWSVYFVRKDLIMPPDIEEALPGWINHVMHSLTAVFIVIEMFVTNKTYPSRRTGIKALMGLSLVYCVWVHYIYFRTGSWVYLFLDVLSHVSRTILLICKGLVGIGLYIFGDKLNASLMAPAKTVSSHVLNKKK